MGGVDTLSITLIGFVPEDYIVEVTPPDMDISRIHCIKGSKQDQDSIHHPGHSSCRSWGVMFSEFSPEEIAVTVIWDNREITQTLKPTYRIELPNGPGCEPECRVGTTEIIMPIK